MISLTQVIENPTEINQELFFKELQKIEYQLLQEAEKLPYKSQEYFAKRTEAFSFRRNTAMKLIRLWMQKYHNVNECPMKYADTLNIPFQTIKTPE